MIIVERISQKVATYAFLDNPTGSGHCENNSGPILTMKVAIRLAARQHQHFMQ